MMSFRNFKDEVFIVLEVKEGYGFGFATHPLIITANLVGNVHESFITEASPQPKFENEFVWVMEKSKMKSIWADKVPVRVECFTVNNSRREKVGYTILNVKEAQIIHEKSKIVEKQIRLLGLSKEVSLLKPELILSFYITDIPIKSPQLTPHYSPRLENNKVRMAEEPPRVTLGTGCEHFIISIEVHSTSNLNELLLSDSYVEATEISYSYHLLGAEIVSNSSTSHGVRVAVTSNLATLKTYFLREPIVTINILLDSLMVGECFINMENLILSEEFHSKKSKHQQRKFPYHCEVTPVHKAVEGPPTFKAFVDFVVTFGCEAPVAKKKSENVQGLVTSSQISVGAGGDADCCQTVKPLEKPKTLALATRPNGGETYRTQPSVTNHPVSVMITLTELLMDKELPPQSLLRINHPGGIPVVPPEVLVPANWTPQQFQLTLPSPIPPLQSCSLLLLLVSGDQVITQATLTPPPDMFSSANVKPCEQSVRLQCDQQRVGEARVWWCQTGFLPTHLSAPHRNVSTLTDSSLTPPSLSRHNGVIPTTEFDVLSPRARELKILSFVEELEDWAEKQRILVMEGLKEEEALRLSQWEAEVGSQVTEGRQLLEALHVMRDQLRAQESDLHDNQYKLKVYKEELERVHHSKLQEFKVMSRRMQDEFNHKLALIASDKASLEREVERLREENAQIKQRLEEVEARTDTDKRQADNLTYDMKMLKEKLSMEQESKNFFKEHCRKAEQEIHRLNCLRQQELEARLCNEKKTLEQLAFQQIVVEKNDLRQDQKVLDEIRQQLLHSSVNINLNSNGESVFSDGQPFADDRHIRRAT